MYVGRQENNSYMFSVYINFWLENESQNSWAQIEFIIIWSHEGYITKCSDEPMEKLFNHVLTLQTLHVGFLPGCPFLFFMSKALSLAKFISLITKEKVTRPLLTMPWLFRTCSYWNNTDIPAFCTSLILFTHDAARPLSSLWMQTQSKVVTVLFVGHLMKPKDRKT